MKRRSWLEIVAEILTLCRTWQSPSRVMLKTNLSFTQARFHLNELSRRHMLEHNGRRYTTTARGLKFQHDLENIFRDWDKTKPLVLEVLA